MSLWVVGGCVVFVLVLLCVGVLAGFWGVGWLVGGGVSVGYATRMGGVGVGSVMVWMGLEVTGEDVAEDLALIHYYRGDLTAVSYEQYELGSSANLELIPGISNVTGAVLADGLEAWPMIISASLGDIVRLLGNESGFISAAVSIASHTNISGFNVDFEPSAQANASVALSYARFLTVFADALHRVGKRLSVDVASWNGFWNFSDLANTSVDMFYDMDTYAAGLAEFENALSTANSTIPHGKLGVGLITVDVDTGAPLGYDAVLQRFELVEDYGVRSIAIWDMPLPSFWWNLTAGFLNTSVGGIPRFGVRGATFTPRVFDVGQSVELDVDVGVVGGLPPYVYTFYLDGSTLAVASTQQSNLSLELPLGGLTVGSHTISVSITDEEGENVTTNTTIMVNPDPNIYSFTVNYTKTTPLYTLVSVGVGVGGGTPPYTYTWHINQSTLPPTYNESTITLNLSRGVYQVYVTVGDAVGYTVSSQAHTVEAGSGSTLGGGRPTGVVSGSSTPSAPRATYTPLVIVLVAVLATLVFVWVRRTHRSGLGG
ncbi:MAG: hypothetical protein QW514_10215 [Thermoprotei archaeon]